VFKPVISGLAIISHIRRLYPDHFGWKQPPYEYVYDKLPFDVIAGTSTLRYQVEAGAGIEEVEQSWRAPLAEFMLRRKQYLLYEE
jgi:uncharacterized protein YbbC (DUF1343 family)